MKRGFTLIELLVVVLIIGILSAVALPQYQKAVMKADLAKMQVILNSVVTAQKAYFLENGDYAPSLEELVLEIPISGTCKNGAGYDGWEIGNDFCLYYPSRGGVFSVQIAFKRRNYGLTDNDLRYSGYEWVAEKGMEKGLNPQMYCRTGADYATNDTHCKGKVRQSNWYGMWFDME